jgi:hypothetical protein
MTETLHILPGVKSTVALPVTFYVSPELFADETFTDERIAELLHRDLLFAVGRHRERWLEERRRGRA